MFQPDAVYLYCQSKTKQACAYAVSYSASPSVFHTHSCGCFFWYPLQRCQGGTWAGGWGEGEGITRFVAWCVSDLAWKSCLAAFMLLITSPTLPTTAAKTNTPMRNVIPVKMYSYVTKQIVNSLSLSLFLSLSTVTVIKYHFGYFRLMHAIVCLYVTFTCGMNSIRQILAEIKKNTFSSLFLRSKWPWNSAVVKTRKDHAKSDRSHFNKWPPRKKPKTKTFPCNLGYLIKQTAI